MDIESFKVDLNKCIDDLIEDLTQIRTGRATPELVQEILINAYGTQSPLKSFATINASDAKSLIVIPWDKGITDNICKGIIAANMGFNAIAEGDHIRVTIPTLTEERRKEYVKVMKERVEDARVAVRQVRQKYMQDIDEQQKAGMSEDEADRLRQEGEKLVKESNARIEEIKERKEEELMTI